MYKITNKSTVFLLTTKLQTGFSEIYRKQNVDVGHVVCFNRSYE